jgi:ubiquinone biosynthesis protein COQ9
MRPDSRLADRRDRLLAAVLPNVAFDGWSLAALRAAAAETGISIAEAMAAFPAGGIDLVSWFSDWADRRMLVELPSGIETMRVRDRIAACVRTRLAVLAPHREAVRASLAILALPQNTPQAARLLYATVDAMWYASGDTATDFNFYTKRALLAGVYAATTLYWLDDRSLDFAETHAFLDRRLADVMAIPKVTARLRSLTSYLPNPFRLIEIVRRR